MIVKCSYKNCTGEGCYHSGFHEKVATCDISCWEHDCVTECVPVKKYNGRD